MNMVYAVCEFNGQDDVIECRNEKEANDALDQMQAIPLGYMIDTGELYLANIYPKTSGDSQHQIMADLFPRIKRAIENHKKKHQDG